MIENKEGPASCFSLNRFAAVNKAAVVVRLSAIQEALDSAETEILQR